MTDEGTSFIHHTFLRSEDKEDNFNFLSDGMPVIPVNLPHGGRDAGLVGAAVGGVIGGLVFLLLLILIALVLYYRSLVL